MYVSELIQKNIPAVQRTDKVGKALEIVTQEQLTHITVADDLHWLGMVTEECLWSMDDEQTIEEAQMHFQRFFLQESNQLLDTFKIYETYDTNIIPIINEKEQYVGPVLMEDVVYYFSKFPFVEERGALLEVEIPFNNYSMEEVARIVESNGAKLFGALITDMNNEHITLTLKITNDNLSSIGETFERFGYVVKQKLYQDTKDQLMEERYQQLQKYLNP